MAKTRKFPLDARVAVSLSAASYLVPGKPPAQQRTVMNEALRIAGLPTGDDWTLVWGPETVAENLSFIARGPRLPSGGRRYAYAVRGTILEPKNLLEDLLDSLGLEPLPWGGPNGDAQISEGSRIGWEHLTAATDGGANALEYLRGVEPRSELMVTGHSLGGMLAAVMALYFHDELGSQLKVRPITFAGPTAGDRRFADVSAEILGGAGRFHNCLDIVPMAYERADLESIRDLYPAAVAPKCGDHVACRGLVDLMVDIAGDRYFQPPGGTRLEARVYNEGGGSFKDFLEEALGQHRANHYMWLLGIPLQAIRELTPEVPPWSPPTIPCECPS
jgi:pimeloyl-ACP methyl ester carboxylesterase